MKTPVTYQGDFTRLTPSLELVDLADHWFGAKEKPQNQGFEDPILERKMRAVGWQPGQSWCAWFVRVCLEALFAHDEAALVVVRRVVGGGAVAIWQNAQKEPPEGLFQTGKTPKPGSIAVWKRVGGWQGHTGIVKEVSENGSFTTIEGNTGRTGGSNGDRV